MSCTVGIVGQRDSETVKRVEMVGTGPGRGRGQGSGKNGGAERQCCSGYM
jgi:hypothetical protein